MCGIAGIYAYRDIAEPIDSEALLRMREAMITRGPDGAGTWLSPNRRLGLAHRRLAIIDLSDAGVQPMGTSDGRLQVTFNGEIYNYRELRRELEGKGYVFRTSSDTEVLLHLYRDRGSEMVHALRGMYAFAIFDVDGDSLFLARDPFGIKPLYYADDGRTFRFASQVKALAEALDAGAPSPAGYVGFFLWGHVPDPYTLHRDIRALPAGSSLMINRASPGKPRVFFNVSEEYVRASGHRAESFEGEARQRLADALRESVARHLIADVPVGVFLSSGLDSATLTGLAAEIQPGQLNTITLGFREYEGTSDDETPLAAKIARHFDTAHETRWISKADFDAHFERLLQMMDQPTIDGVNVYFVSLVAAMSGLKVALSGLGGDELFRGYPSFRQIPSMVNALGIANSAPAAGRGFRRISAPILEHFTSPKYAGLLEYGGTYGGAYLLRRGLYMPWELPTFLDGALVKEGWSELQTMLRLEDTAAGPQTDAQKVSALEMCWYMRNQLLRDSDWAGMAHSLEIRVPLVDLDLFRAVAPWTSRSGPTKRDMASSPRIPLPEEVLNRTKTGFRVPVRDWLPTTGEGKERGARAWARHVIARQGTLH